MTAADLFELRTRFTACTRTETGVHLVVPGIGTLELSSIGDDERLCVTATEYVVHGEADGLREARRRELARIARALVGGDVAHVFDPHGILGQPTKRGVA